jgi:hypothetical protein
MSGRLHSSAALPPGGKSPRYPLDRRLGAPQKRSGWHGEKKILDPRPSVAQPAASHYTDYVNPALFTVRCFWNSFLLYWSCTFSEKRTKTWHEFDSQETAMLFTLWSYQNLNQGILDFIAVTSYPFLAPVAENLELKKGVNLTLVFGLHSLPNGLFSTRSFQTLYNFRNGEVSNLFFNEWETPAKTNLKSTILYLKIRAEHFYCACALL